MYLPAQQNICDNLGNGVFSDSFCGLQVEDVLFAAGEALSFLWGGVPVTADVILKTNYSTLSMSSNFLMGDVNLSVSKYSTGGADSPSEDCHPMVRDAIRKKLFDELLFSTRKEERCSGTVWLLSITMYCGNHPAIQKMLPEIQVCQAEGNFSSDYFNTHHCLFFILDFSLNFQPSQQRSRYC